MIAWGPERTRGRAGPPASGPLVDFLKRPEVDALISANLADLSGFSNPAIDFIDAANEALSPYHCGVGPSFLMHWVAGWDILDPHVRRAIIGLSLLSDDMCQIDGINLDAETERNWEILFLHWKAAHVNALIQGLGPEAIASLDAAEAELRVVTGIESLPFISSGDQDGWRTLKETILKRVKDAQEELDRLVALPSADLKLALQDLTKQLEGKIVEAQTAEERRRIVHRRHLIRPGGLVETDIGWLAGITSRASRRRIRERLEEIGALRRRKARGRQPHFFPEDRFGEGSSFLSWQMRTKDLQRFADLVRDCAPSRRRPSKGEGFKLWKSKSGPESILFAGRQLIRPGTQEAYFSSDKWAVVGGGMGVYVIGSSVPPEVAHFISSGVTPLILSLGLARIGKVDYAHILRYRSLCKDAESALKEDSSAVHDWFEHMNSKALQSVSRKVSRKSWDEQIWLAMRIR